MTRRLICSGCVFRELLGPCTNCVQIEISINSCARWVSEASGPAPSRIPSIPVEPPPYPHSPRAMAGQKDDHAQPAAQAKEEGSFVLVEDDDGAGPSTTEKPAAAGPATTEKPADVHSCGWELPPGVASVEQWGLTVIEFGTTHKGSSYMEVIQDKKNASYLSWVKSHGKTGALLDFAKYLKTQMVSQITESDKVITGTMIIRKFKSKKLDNDS